MQSTSITNTFMGPKEYKPLHDFNKVIINLKVNQNGLYVFRKIDIYMKWEERERNKRWEALGL